MYFELFLIKKIIRKYHIEKVIIFGNYSLVKLKIMKFVLVHHSYLLDDDAYARLNGMPRLIEFFRRSLFELTLLSSPILIVQSEYMKSLLKKKIGMRGNEIVVIANPISRNFANEKAAVRKYPGSGTFTLFFPSRAHTHKNHEFVLRIAKYLRSMGFSDIHFIITVDSQYNQGKSIIKKIAAENLGDIVENIGELPQSELQEYYKKCSALFFPSTTETFGNPLIEGMYYGLPVIAPDLPYAVEICGKAGCFYEPGSVASAMAQINALRNEEAYLKHCLLSVEQAQKYPGVAEWVDQYLNL
jgi:glycosyltransferase involved in cell wall biosynthesis